MVKREKFWHPSVYAKAVGLASDRNVSIWFEKGWIDMALHNGRMMVVDNKKSRVRLKHEAPRHVTSMATAGVTKAEKPKAVLKVIKPPAAILVKRRPHRIPGDPEFVSKARAAQFLGVKLSRLDEMKIGFVLIGTELYLLAGEVEYRKSELEVEAELARLMAA